MHALCSLKFYYMSILRGAQLQLIQNKLRKNIKCVKMIGFEALKQGCATYTVLYGSISETVSILHYGLKNNNLAENYCHTYYHDYKTW